MNSLGPTPYAGMKVVVAGVPFLAKVVARGRQVAVDAVQFHHPFPQYLGGNFQQLLEPLPKELHDAYHAGLDALQPRQWGKAYYDALSAEQRAAVLKELGEFTRDFDAKYGTHLYDAMVREGFKE